MPKKSEKVIIDITTIATEEKALNAAVMDFITIKSAIKELESQLEAQKSIISSYAQANNINGIQFLNHVIDYVPGTEYTTFNKDKFKQNLLAYGVAAKIIADAETESTEEKERAGYLKIRELKK
ncbi:MAG: hypothetical protein ACFFDY_01055 [Candidatus Thorarchaeota archaeon]